MEVTNSRNVVWSELNKIFDDEKNINIIYEYQNLIPKKYPEYHIENIGSDRVVYNPVSVPQISSLDEISFRIFEIIDGKKSTKALYKEAVQKKVNITLSQVCVLVSKFYKSGLIYFYRPNNVFDIRSNDVKSIEVWFHITNNCNLRCKYCFIHKTPMRMSKRTISKAIKRITISAYENGVQNVYIKFAGGEPLLEIENIKYAIQEGNRLAKKYNIRLIYSIMTNGILLNEKCLEIIDEYKIDICISVDGLNKAQDLNRCFINGAGSSKIVMDSIHRLIERKSNFVINSVVTYENVFYLKEWVSFLLKKRIRFGLSLERESSPLNKNDIKKKNDDLFITEMKKVYKYIYEHVPEYKIVHRLLSLTSFDFPKIFPCGMGTFYYMIKANGDITNCPIMADHKIGSIFQNEDIMEVMRKKDPTAHVSVFNKTGCKTCIFKHSCSGQCPFQAFFYYRKFTLPSPMCKVFKTLIPELIRIEGMRQIKYGIDNLYIKNYNRE